MALLNLCNGKCCGYYKVSCFLNETKDNFISSMKVLYRGIVDIETKPLTIPRIDSWKDEYDQLQKIFKNNRIYDDLYIVFEYKMPKSVTYPNNGNSVYCDVVLVSETAELVIEFKQMYFKNIATHPSEAAKYKRRLYELHQYTKNNNIPVYTSMFMTKETKNEIRYRTVPLDTSKTKRATVMIGSQTSMESIIRDVFFNKTKYKKLKDPKGYINGF